MIRSSPRCAEQGAPGKNAAVRCCYLGLELWKRLELNRFFEEAIDEAPADVPWSGIAALLTINRLCAPGSELAVEQRWYPRLLWMICWDCRSKINDTACTAAWIVSCRTRRSWKDI